MKITRHSAGGILRLALVFSATLLGLSAQEHKVLPKRLPRLQQGPGAISALGADLPVVASAHGLSADKLAALFQKQRGLAVDPDGALLFVCDAPVAVPAAGSTAAGGSALIVAGSDTTDPFKLHSFPGATRVIYLDFTGHTTSGTQWNTSFTSGSPITSAPFDLDGSPTTFGTSEQTLIRRVWQRVAEDYAPFAIDVTTEDPGLEALRKTTSSDNDYGVRVVISPTNWYSTGAGGVGYVGSFKWSSDTPCFVFTAQLGNAEKYIAEAAAHEAGHTLGLYHDGATGTAATEYYSGQGDWAPIMGVSYYKSVTQFSRGEYANANNTQDDFAVISTFVPFAADDHGDTLAAASTLTGPTIADGGTIETNTDVDVFRFVTGAGLVTLNVQGPSPEPNLDVKAELLDVNGVVLQTSNPSGVNASISATLSAGTYYLRISGVGAGDPATTGYSNYGSVGNYLVTGSLAGSSVIPPTLTVPADITSEATGPSGAVVAFVTSAVDSTGKAIATSASPASGSTFAIGITTVTVTATDSAGTPATKTFLVTVRDTTPPVITVPANITTAATSGSGAAVSFSTSATDSVSGARPTTNSPVSGSTFPVGTTTVTASATDAAGNTATRTFTVTVTGASAPSAPSGLVATAGDLKVDLDWNAVGAATGYNIKRSTTSGGPYTTVASSLTGVHYTDSAVSNGPTYYYVVTATNTGGESAFSVQVSATPAGGGSNVPYVTAVVPGTVQNNYSGWVGMQIAVGANPLTVSQLGRMVLPGNTATHTVKLVRASDGTDVAGSTVSVAMSGGTAGQFRYATLATPITLTANTTYYLMSLETSGGDSWYDWDTRLTTASVAADTAVVWGSGGPGTWRTLSASGQSFVPVNLMYTTTAGGGGGGGGGGGSTGTYVTAVTPGTLQNNYTGWLGLQLVVGATPLTVTDLGRMVVAGNSGTHTLKLVKASDGTDVAGSTVSVSMGGGTAGQFRYATLASPITLAANTSYYVLSAETSGGDSWYDWDTKLTLAGVAADTAVVWGSGGPGTWRTLSATSQSFVPVNFKYTTTTPPASGSTYVTAVASGTLQNNYSGWLGMQLVVGSTPVTVSQLGRMMISGNSGTHPLKLVKASDGTDVAGSTVSVSMSGGTAGQFIYSSLASPVTLAANTTYYVLCQETSGGDSWYDWDTKLTTTSAAAGTAVVWGSGGPGTWRTLLANNQSFVPLNFKY